MTKFTLATWNINSVRLRMPIVEEFAKLHAPDIICFQETKVVDEFFPEAPLKEMGYEHLAFSGEKSYNGVAIASKLPLKNIETLYHMPEHKRHISATLENGLEIHNVYVPAGGDIADPIENPKFADKLAFLASLTEWSESIKKNSKTLICGDMNIAPFEHDVWSHKQLLKVVSHTPIEVEKMATLREAGEWVDIAREGNTAIPMDEKLYSWWSYRSKDYLASNRGRRLDHIWVTPALKDTVKSYEVLPDLRGWEKPSDHVPVLVTLEI